MMRTIARVSAAAALAVLATGCAYKSPVAPVTPSPTPSSAAASIRAATSSRNDYTTAVVATVLTADGHFVAGIPIGFATTSGTVSTSLTTTDANGSATTIVTSAANTTVTITIGLLTTSVQVVGASAPSTGAPLPPTTPPPPPSVTPIAIINAPSTAATGTSINLGVSGPALGQTWLWNFGDGTTAQTSAFTTTHTYGTAGIYNITVSAAGVTTGNASITVSNPAGSAAPTLAVTVTCTATAHATPVVCNVSAVTYGTTTIPSASVTAVSWDWGDGNRGAGLFAINTYANPGTYTVVTTVTAPTIDGAKTVMVTKSVAVT